jgi:hypothetical protein
MGQSILDEWDGGSKGKQQRSTSRIIVIAAVVVALAGAVVFSTRMLEAEELNSAVVVDALADRANSLATAAPFLKGRLQEIVQTSVQRRLMADRNDAPDILSQTDLVRIERISNILSHRGGFEIWKRSFISKVIDDRSRLEVEKLFAIASSPGGDLPFVESVLAAIGRMEQLARSEVAFVVKPGMETFYDAGKPLRMLQINAVASGETVPIVVGVHGGGYEVVPAVSVEIPDYLYADLSQENAAGARHVVATKAAGSLVLDWKIAMTGRTTAYVKTISEKMQDVTILATGAWTAQGSSIDGDLSTRLTAAAAGDAWNSSLRRTVADSANEESMKPLGLVIYGGNNR